MKELRFSPSPSSPPSWKSASLGERLKLSPLQDAARHLNVRDQIVIFSVGTREEGGQSEREGFSPSSLNCDLWHDWLIEEEGEQCASGASGQRRKGDSISFPRSLATGESPFCFAPSKEIPIIDRPRWSSPSPLLSISSL